MDASRPGQPADEPATLPVRALAPLYHFFGSWRFPLFVLSVLFFYNAMILGVSLIPADNEVLGQFAQDFRRWCFSYEAADQRVEWGYIVPFITVPTVLVIVTVAFWGRTLREIPKVGFGRAAPWVVGPAVLVAAAGWALAGLTPGSGKTPEESAADALAFPAEKLRTEHPAPSFSLVNQEGEVVSMESLRGRVVVMTGLYATCRFT